VNYFWYISYGLEEGEEEDIEEIHMSQNIVITRNGSKTYPLYSPSTSEPAKTTSTTQKAHPSGKPIVHSTPPSKLDYDFLEDLKKNKS